MADDVYYTLRYSNTMNQTLELTKWSWGETLPLDVYTSQPMKPVACSCPSPKRPCKHWEIKKALLAHGAPLDQLYWSESLGIQEVHDIPA